jgi:hypothetical protein
VPADPPGGPVERDADLVVFLLPPSFDECEPDHGRAVAFLPSPSLLAHGPGIITFGVEARPGQAKGRSRTAPCRREGPVHLPPPPSAGPNVTSCEGLSRTQCGLASTIDWMDRTEGRAVVLESPRTAMRRRRPRLCGRRTGTVVHRVECVQLRKLLKPILVEYCVGHTS